MLSSNIQYKMKKQDSICQNIASHWGQTLLEKEGSAKPGGSLDFIILQNEL
jgi:hypothetical protein